MATITLNEANFEREVNESVLPVLVGFGTDIDSVNARMNGSYKCCKADSALAKRCRVRKMPTLLLYRGGKVTDTIVGSLAAEQVVKILS